MYYILIKSIHNVFYIKLKWNRLVYQLLFRKEA